MDLSDTDSSDPSHLTNSGELTPKPELPVVCRPHPGGWWLVWVAVIEGGFAIAAPFLPYDDISLQVRLFLLVITWTIASVIGYGVLPIASDLKRGEIRADSDGITWRRNFSGWKSTRWGEIIDFYQLLPSEPGSRVLETPSGKLTLSASFRDIDRVADLVVERALHLNLPGWETKGFRRGEKWSRTFSPWTNAEKWPAPLASVAIVTCILIVVFIPREQSKPVAVSQISMGFWLDTFPQVIGLVFVAFLLMVFSWALGWMWLEWKRAWNLRKEKLTLSDECVVFTDGTSTLNALWKEVVEISQTERPWSRGIRFKTTSGDFEITLPRQDMTHRILPILREIAPQALQRPVSRESRQALINARLNENYANLKVKDGVQIWTYRSIQNQFVLFCVSVFIAFAPIIIYVQIRVREVVDIDVPTGSPWPAAFAILSLSSLVILLFWIWFKRAILLTDHGGLELRSPFHRPWKAEWKDIQGIDYDVWGEFVRVNGRKLYFTRIFQPFRAEEFRKLIREKMSVETLNSRELSQSKPFGS